MNNTKSIYKKRMTIGAALLSIVVIGIIAGFQLLQRPVDIRNQAEEIDACRAMVVTCNVTYSLDSSPRGEKASSPIYLLNEAGVKVRFGGGENREGEMNFPNTDGQSKTIPFDFNQINHDDYFVDADGDGKAKVKCVVPKFEDENESGWAQVRGNPCCTDPGKIQSDENNNGVDDSCESGSQDEMLCRYKQSPCYQGQCKCEDIFKTAADVKNPKEGDTVFPYPTYYRGQPGIQDGRVIFPKPLPTCINCSSLKIFALDSRGQKIEPPIKVYPTEKPEPGKKYGACLNEDNKKVNDNGFEYKCNQGQNPAEPGADPDGCREYKFEMKNAYDDPAPEAACVPVEPQSCSLGCKSCCPSCNAEQPQPLMVGVKKRVIKAGAPAGSKDENDYEWQLQQGFQCQASCNFGVDNLPEPEWQPNGEFKKGNELVLGETPERGQAYPTPNPNKAKCIAVGENVRLNPHPRAEGDTIDWDEYDFKNGRPKPTSVVPTSGLVLHIYDDPGVYDMTLTCRKGNDDPSDDEMCVKRLVMKCGNTPPGDDIPGEPGNPPPPGGDNPACYDDCVPGVTSCGTGMSCVDVGDGSTGTGADYRCVMHPDNNCKDMPDGEKEACYCSQPTPTPTPGVCRAQVSAKCEPLN